MRIGIDARFYGPTGKGIGRYTEKLIESMEKLDDQNEYFVFLRSEGYELYNPKKKNWHKVMADYPWYSVQEQIALPRLLNQYNLDLVHFLHLNVPLFYNRRFVVTGHDLTHQKFNPQSSTHNFWQYLIKYLFFCLISSVAIERAQKIITVSRFVKNQIIDYYKINPNKIIITYESFMPSTSSKLEIRNLKLNINVPYLLYVGNAYPHKNLERLLMALKEIIKTQNIFLVLVGKIDYFYQRLQKLVQELSLNEKVFFVGQISDEDLRILYQNALAYIFPSLMEGFGLPGLEAMANNCPVVSSGAGSLPEIYESAALYFNPQDISDMIQKINKIITDEPLRQEFKDKGQEQIKKYSWEKCAQETLQIYKNLKI